MAYEEGKPIQPLARGEKAPEFEQEIQDLQALINQEQKLAKEAEGTKQTVSAETLAQLAKYLPRLIQRTLAKLDATQVYQTFKLPGRDVIVRDRRQAEGEAKTKEKSDSIAAESKQSLEELLLQKGKLIKPKEQTYENYLGDVSKQLPLSEQKVAAGRLQQFFSRFEETLLKRFERGAKMEQPIQNGECSFLQKTAVQWRNFFGRFVARTVKRYIGMEQIQEWIYRGLVQRQARATVISDWTLTNGQLEKFVRYRLPGEAQNFAQMLAALQPGSKLSKEELKRFLSGELEYLAIKAAQEEAAFVQAPLKGKFLTTAQAEEKVASDLGLQLGAQLREKEKVLRDLGGRRRRGGGGGLFGETSEEESQVPETPFIPWWQFGPLRKGRGPARWFVAVFYLVLISLVVVGILSLF